MGHMRRSVAGRTDSGGQSAGTVGAALADLGWVLSKAAGLGPASAHGVDKKRVPAWPNRHGSSTAFEIPPWTRPCR